MWKPAWRPLQKGDKVYVIAPASAKLESVDITKIYDFFAREFEDLTLVFPEQLVNRYLHMANVPEKRAGYLIEALCDPDIAAIWCLAGGEGSIETTTLLHRRYARSLLKEQAKERAAVPLIGFSDTIALHVFLGQCGLISPIHAPNLMSFSHPRDDKDPSVLRAEIECLRSILYKEKHILNYASLAPLNKSAREERVIQGEIVGGYMASLQASIGTFWQADTAGKILLLEGCHAPYEAHGVIEVLLHMQHAGMFAQVMAVMFGDIKTASQEEGAYVKSMIAQCAHMLDQAKVPVIAGLPLGHAGINMPLPLHTEAKLHLGEAPSFEVVTVRSLSSIGDARKHYLAKEQGDGSAASYGEEAPYWAVVGGNIYAIQRTIGTDFQIETSGKVLFMEDRGSACLWQPEKLHTALEQMLLAGLFDEAKGVIIGDVHVVLPEHQERIYQILTHFVQKCRIPVAYIGADKEYYALLYALREGIHGVRIKPEIIHFPSLFDVF